LLVLRHAQSIWNAEGRWQGWADPPLSSVGEQQSREAAALLAGEEPFRLVVSSDLMRARRTAELIAEALEVSAPVAIEPGLRELDVGQWTGCTFDQIEDRWPGAVARFGRGEIGLPPGGEARADFDARVVAASRRIAAAAESCGGVRLLVVAHGGVVRAMARAVGAAEYRVGHLAGYRGTYSEGGLLPTESVNLLDVEVAADGGESTVAPVL
jgi:2,3-bisphosphoglycerate-dependent phosphoglycerate mutase